MKMKRGAVEIDSMYGNRIVEAAILSSRVAVTQYGEGCGYKITDPVTGRSYGYRFWETERSAIRFARRMMAEFGDNPLRGSIWKGDKFTRRPMRAVELRAFCEGRRRVGHHD